MCGAPFDIPLWQALKNASVRRDLAAWTSPRAVGHLTERQYEVFHAPTSSPRDVATILRGVDARYSENLRLKIVLAGFKRQGKTSFVNALLGKEPQTDSEPDRTRGVDIRVRDVIVRRDESGFSLPAVTVTFYDFAGHEEYYCLHDRFLTEDCLCVVTAKLSDFKKDRDRAESRVVSWLSNLAASARRGSYQESKNVCVVLLGTHLDKVRSLAEGWFTSLACGHGSRADGRLLL